MAKDLFSSHPPFTPPTTEEDRLFWLRLIRSPRVGATTFHRLMREHGTAAAALDALPAIAQAAGVTDYTPCLRDKAEAEIDQARAKGARMLCFGTEAYPASLASIADAPPVLWCMGQRKPVLRPMVALVGARNASSLGTRMARTLAEGLGLAGYTVVSGLARGVDAAAHHGSLKTGTIAVMAGGVDVIYPVENTVLAAAIADQGLRMSEQPMGLHPQGRHFPPRNRIISGLSLAVVVVEAAEKSGTLITVQDALEQGREVMAVPGHPVDGRAGGCNRLIREGATLVRHVEDVLEALQRLQDKPRQDDPSPQGPSPEVQAGARHASGVSQSTEQAKTAHKAMQPAPNNKTGASSTRNNRQEQCKQPAPQGAGDCPSRPADSTPLDQRILDCLGPSPVAEDQVIRDLALPAATLAPALVILELQGQIRRHPGALISRS
ncbi:MAG: DNA-protecting protein DprA [Rhodobacteraceae bacterium]|nr:MAG: DNA-protecting protein DprA [Paracoccaceae bacterium]